nr:MAG TPA: hypothetical protein [Caudoviricetes sp.]
MLWILYQLLVAKSHGTLMIYPLANGTICDSMPVS